MSQHQGEPNSSSKLSLVRDFSLEMTGKDVPALTEAKDVIPPGTKINVTFLGNEDLEMRVSAAKAVLDMGFIPVPHISARRIASQAQLEEFLGRLQEVGASKHVFAVGGDPAEPEGPYPHSLSLIETGLFSEYGVKEVSIAGYPEGHPDIDDETLWDHLERKVGALGDQQLESVILTQFAFDADPVHSWVTQVRSRGIATPIRIGVAGPAGIKRLVSMAKRFGIRANALVIKKYGFSLANLVGTAGPGPIVTELEQRFAADSKNSGNSVPGDVKLHFYTFGGLRAATEWAGDYLSRQENLS